MKPDDVKNVIKTTVKNADANDISRSNQFNNKIVYSGSELPSDIDKVKVVYNRETGQIVTAYPLN